MCCAGPVGLNLDAWSGGAYWTHYGPGDWYVDAVAQATRYDGAASTQFARLATTGFGFVSLAGDGVIGSNSRRCSDRALSWIRRRRSSGNVCRSTTPMTAWVGRTRHHSGAAGGSACAANGPLSATAGRCGSLMYAPICGVTGGRGRRRPIQAGSGAATRAGQPPATGRGLTVKTSANVSLYANADYQLSVGDTDGGRRNGVRGAAGIRYTW